VAGIVRQFGPVTAARLTEFTPVALGVNGASFGVPAGPPPPNNVIDSNWVDVGAYTAFQLHVGLSSLPANFTLDIFAQGRDPAFPTGGGATVNRRICIIRDGLVARATIDAQSSTSAFIDLLFTWGRGIDNNLGRFGGAAEYMQMNALVNMRFSFRTTTTMTAALSATLWGSS